jgi:hypothetical protein
VLLPGQHQHAEPARPRPEGEPITLEGGSTGLQLATKP